MGNTVGSGDVGGGTINELIVSSLMFFALMTVTLFRVNSARSLLFRDSEGGKILDFSINDETEISSLNTGGGLTIYLLKDGCR